ncbi:V-type immunoglobulin domain-containing suppressor of T-cell activation isoform X2 [Oenanthe melanoleuca]|uniref:V-type immunoglobulin domain-containing suppressor of T-cell activation isoform X2 n=1 Tax=Oenanthe melanoleuca TaxID=2939378 RepID=UPI0024C1CEE0|nr:V-type immunoglobulin domain-containing suppressor of T-cell activation isoform X2 [Oenanthe melanoleuca]
MKFPVCVCESGWRGGAAQSMRWLRRGHLGVPCPPATMGTAKPRTGLLLAALCLLASHGGRAAAFLISTPFSLCVCPEGQNVTLSCRISGALAERHDLLYKTWYFSSTGDQSCSDKRHVRNATEKELHHDLARHHNGSQKSPPGRHRGVELVPDRHGAFHIVVMNLTLQDSGNYCCYAVEVRREGHGKPRTAQVAHGFVELQIQPGKGGLQNCTFHTATGKDITAAALATGACIVGILCLPLILLLIYKQRQAATSRRAHELVRMDSKCPGHRKPRVRGGAAGGRGATAPAPAVLCGQQAALRVWQAPALRAQHPPVPPWPRGLLLPHPGSCSRLT